MREDEDGMNLHQRRQTQGRPEVIREDEERRAIRDKPAQRHPIEDCAHTVFAHSKVEIACAIISLAKVSLAFDQRIRRRSQVCRPTQERGQAGRDGIQHFPGGLAGRHGFFSRTEGGKLGRPTFGKFALDEAIPFRPEARVSLSVFGDSRLPFGLRFFTALDGFTEVCKRFLGDVELRSREASPNSPWSTSLLLHPADCHAPRPYPACWDCRSQCGFGS